MGEGGGGTQGNKVHKFVLNDVSVSTVLSKIVVIQFKHLPVRIDFQTNAFFTEQPEIVAFPSVGFKVAAWLWSNGYSSADNSSLPTGNLGKFCNGTEYSFAELSINIHQSNSGIEKLFQYWRHILKVKLT